MTLRVLNFTSGYSLGALYVLAQLATYKWRSEAGHVEWQVANNQND